MTLIGSRDSMRPDALDFVTVKIPRPLALRWARNGLDPSTADEQELMFWLKAGFDWDNNKKLLFEAWGHKYLQ